MKHIGVQKNWYEQGKLGSLSIQTFVIEIPKNLIRLMWPYYNILIREERSMVNKSKLVTVKAVNLFLNKGKSFVYVGGE
jgi:hypothetical protein